MPRGLRLATLLLAGLALTLSCARPHEHDATTARWFGDLTPPTDNVFRFNLGAEPENFDPSFTVGQADGRVALILFEGLTREDSLTLEPRPGCAERWDVSADGITYTFHLRRGLQWSDGSPLTSRDFLYSWLRVLEPKNAAKFAGQLYPVRNAEAFNTGRLTNPDSVGIAAPDESTLVVTLEHPTAYFLSLTNFYTLCPVPRHTVERFGPRWTRPENIVCNGPFVLTEWRQNSHFRFRKNPRFWNAARVRLDGILAFSIDDLNTSINLYKSGAMDWVPSGYLPSPFIPYLREYADFRHGRYQGTYFYSVNVTRPPFDNVWVRRALNYAIDRNAISNDLLRGSRDPWGNFLPSGYPGYRFPPGFTFDPQKARECLARAGFPGGKGMRKISILINTSEDHRRIAEAIQAMWKRELGIQVEISNQEWGSYLASTRNLQYDVARRSWIGDYLDPYSFLSIALAGDGNNRTGWKDARYDGLLHRSAAETDPAKRMAIFTEAESLLLADGPFLTVYHYSTNEMVKPWVRGIERNALDIHPLNYVWIDHDWKPDAAPAVATRRGTNGASAMGLRLRHSTPTPPRRTHSRSAASR